MAVKDLKISVRLVGAFGTLVAIMLAVAALAFIEVGSIRTAAHEIGEDWLPSVERVNQIRARASDLRSREMLHVLNTDTNELASIDKMTAEIVAALDAEKKEYVQLLSSDDERKHYEAFLGDWRTFLEVHERVVALSRKNDKAGALKLVQGESRQAFRAAMEHLDKLVALNHAGAVEAGIVVEGSVARARMSLLVATLLALVFAGIASTWLIRSITRPLRIAVDATARVAGGDLSKPVQADANDETGNVLQALQRMQEELTHTVAAVRSNAESVATASAEIAQGNNDLSQRTEEQASALEETAATMEELSTTVRNNAANAGKANQLAQGASEIAGRGGEVVGDVVTTMRRISESSRRINEIIAVIDGIAFQTNILALNAAVEAARAGEQGRGFAVVASEVRSLAQRSSQAAKEIKALITTSVDEVQQAGELVDRAGQTMQEIVDAVKHVSDVVAEISAATSQQSSGIAQVVEAVTQMDQMTQQNAALVEESAAAASSLRQQAQQLVETVAVFRLGDAATTSAPARHEGPERRGPNRATNVVRPKFKAKPAPAKIASAPAPASTGTDGWVDF